MTRIMGAHWIKRTHVFDADEYECSACGQRFSAAALSCPACGAPMRGMEDPQDWVDEMMELDIILGDD